MCWVYTNQIQKSSLDVNTVLFVVYIYAAVVVFFYHAKRWDRPDCFDLTKIKFTFLYQTSKKADDLWKREREMWNKNRHIF